MQSAVSQKQLGGLSPEKALEYMKKRPDIPEISYVAGSPHAIMKEYNEWKKGQK